jgi:hypothetical protein
MKIVVNRGKTVRVVVKPGVGATETEPGIPPVTKSFGPTALLELADADAQFLIDRGIARKYDDRDQSKVLDA